MTPEEILQALRAAGATVEPRLRVEAPPGLMTEELHDALVASKEAVIRLLLAPEQKAEPEETSVGKRQTAPQEPRERHPGLIF